MLNYLYYKLYQASLKSSLNDIPEFMTSVSFGGLISVNILVLNAFLSKMDILPFLFSNKIQVGVFVLITILFPMIFYNKKRCNSLQKKYSMENNEERKKGSIIVVIYIALSFLSIFAVAFFKPGKL